MSLIDNISSDLKNALKTGDKQKASVLRMLLAALNNKRIEKGRDLKKEEEGQVVVKEIKSRQESVEAYQKGNRPDLVKNEKKEIEVLKEYQPQMMSREEIKKTIESIPDFDKFKGQFGPAMGKAMSQLKGKADSQLVMEVVKELV